MSWIVLAFLVPIAVAWKNGSTYAYAFSLIGVGALLYLVNKGLVISYLNRRAPGAIEEGWWEETAGTGVVPKWVSVLWALGVGFIPAGIIVAVLLWLGVIVNRG